MKSQYEALATTRIAKDNSKKAENGIIFDSFCDWYVKILYYMYIVLDAPHATPRACRNS